MRSLFPLKPEFEDPDFDDPDQKFNKLKFSSDIPEPYPHVHQLYPLSNEIDDLSAPRHQGPIVFGAGFIFGWIIVGNRLIFSNYGYAITRWRTLRVNGAAGLIFAFLGLISHHMYEFNFSTHASGRKRGLYYEEIMRNAIDARYGLYEGIDLIMVTKDRINRETFFELIVKNYEKQMKEKSDS
jgi:hypothetical protein